jgi:hypothetical protein
MRRRKEKLSTNRRCCANSPDVAKFRIVWKSQLADETVTMYAKPPHASRNRASQQPIRRREAAVQYTHLLLLTAYDLSRVDRQTVPNFGARYPIDDDFVVTR